MMFFVNPKRLSLQQNGSKLIREPLIIINLSLPRRRESSDVKSFWIPAFAGMTFLEVAISIIKGQASPNRLGRGLQIQCPVHSIKVEKSFAAAGRFSYFLTESQIFSNLFN